MVRQTCKVRHKGYSHSALLCLQRKFWNEMIIWRRGIVLDHNCDTEGCCMPHDNSGDIRRHACGDGLCHLTTYVLTFL